MLKLTNDERIVKIDLTRSSRLSHFDVISQLAFNSNTVKEINVITEDDDILYPLHQYVNHEDFYRYYNYRYGKSDEIFLRAICNPGDESKKKIFIRGLNTSDGVIDMFEDDMRDLVLEIEELSYTWSDTDDDSVEIDFLKPDIREEDNHTLEIRKEDFEDITNIVLNLAHIYSLQAVYRMIDAYVDAGSHDDKCYYININDKDAVKKLPTIDKDEETHLRAHVRDVGLFVKLWYYDPFLHVNRKLEYDIEPFTLTTSDGTMETIVNKTIEAGRVKLNKMWEEQSIALLKLYR